MLNLYALTKPTTSILLTRIVVIGLLLFSEWVTAQTRQALIIGNTGYANSPLANPANDATDIAQVLKQLNFTVTELHNLSRKTMRQAIREFTQQLRAGDLGLFYYAGHGVQYEGLNYLVPIGAEIESDVDLPDEAVQASYVLKQMEASGNGVNIVILDACRDNPYKRIFRSGSRGLARMEGPVGSLVAFSTAPGDVAADSLGGRNSPYAQHLIHFLQQKGIMIERVFKNVRKAVLKDTIGKQTPVEESKLVDEVYLAGDQLAVVGKVDSVELAFWQTVLIENTAVTYQAYLDKYPHGLHATLAKIKWQKALGADTSSDLLKRADYLYFNRGQYKEAFNIYLQAANEGNPLAMAALAKIYSRNDLGAKIDDVQASYWRNKAMIPLTALAKQNNAAAQYSLGALLNFGDENNKQSVYWYKKAAKQGYAPGQSNLGTAYFVGKAIKQDHTKAVKYYRKSAVQGYAAAQINLGRMYVEGTGVTPDNKQAVSWYRKAADQGYAAGQVNLGDMYYQGKGVAQNDGQAMSWYLKAAEQGDVQGQRNLGLMYHHGSGVLQDHLKALAWYRQAAEQGDAQAQNNLGNMYEFGQGVVKNKVQAAQWYRKAAAQQYAPAQSNLGAMYEFGFGVEQDNEQAVYWYKNAAMQGDAQAQTSLGLLFIRGLGVTQDFKQAAQWFTKAAAQGEQQSLYMLGVLYEYGWGVNSDKRQAVQWYKKSSEKGYAEAEIALKRLNQ